MWPGREADRSPPSNTEVAKEWSSNPAVPECLRGAEGEREREREREHFSFARFVLTYALFVIV
jgi:hypothetical protein